ncbi:MAG: DUF222 domain-containing protein [Geodermatophilaceae bacterium]
MRSWPARLRLYATEAQRRIDLAGDLRARLAGTAGALRSGELTAAKAEVIAAGVRDLADQVAAGVEQSVLPAASGQTVSELRRAVTRAVLAVDPLGAADRADAAGRRRGVSHIPLADGMSGLWAELAAANAQTVLIGSDTESDRLAAALSAAGEPVSGRSARRADALVLWAQRALAAPHPSTAHGRRRTVHVTAPLTMLLGLDDTPGELAGYGPIDVVTTRRLAVDGTWWRLLTDPRSGVLLDYGRTTYTPPADLREFVLARDQVCTFAGCARPARGCQLDHLHEWHHGGTTRDGNMHPLCLRHHARKKTGDWTATRDPATGTTAWTSPWARPTAPDRDHSPNRTDRNRRPSPIQTRRRSARTAGTTTHRRSDASTGRDAPRIGPHH